jgi:regulator of replication initiation timing
VNSIRSVEVEIENTIKDQRDTRRNEEKKLRHWQKEVVRKREQIAEAFAEGACVCRPAYGRV